MPDDGVRTPLASSSGHARPRLRGAAALARGLCDLKAIRDPRFAGSMADRLFLSGWSALRAGQQVGDVAVAITARALAAITLGAIDETLLADGGLSPPAIRDVLHRALAVAPGDPLAATRFGRGVEINLLDEDPPSFARLLVQQDRAGATAPGKPRIMLPEPESHAAHCLAVAVLGLMIAEDDDAGVAAFLAGFSHHLHNAAMPDSGYAGETLLGDHLAPLMMRFRERALASLPVALVDRLRVALSASVDATTAAGRAFHAADVIDRVAQMGFHARAGAFRVEQATGELGLVHEGPLQAFHQAVLAEVALP